MKKMIQDGQILCNLRKFREENNLSKVTLADRLEISRQTITSIEQGKTIPSVLLALQLAQYFDTKVEHLFEFIDYLDWIFC